MKNKFSFRAATNSGLTSDADFTESPIPLQSISDPTILVILW